MNNSNERKHDFSSFPFSDFSTDELAELFRDAVIFEDDEFADALREEIKKRRST